MICFTSSAAPPTSFFGSENIGDIYYVGRKNLIDFNIWEYYYY